MRRLRHAGSFTKAITGSALRNDQKRQVERQYEVSVGAAHFESRDRQNNQSGHQADKQRRGQGRVISDR